MKKILLCLLTVVCAFSLAACKKKAQNKTYTMSFETNEGSSIADITAKAGEKISKPADPTKEGLTFGGWYADIDLIDIYEFPEVMPGEDVTIYAKWVVTLTFDSKGGPQINPIVLEGGKTFNLPDDPVREGYVFVGWFIDAAYTQRLTYVMPRTNTTAYAKWQVYEVGSSIALDLNFSDNDGVFILNETEEGTKITATSSKGEWSYCGSTINIADNKNTTIKVELVGKAGANVTLKLEGGDAQSPTEQTVTMTGKAQTVVWSCDSTQLSSIAGSKFLVFLNGGVVGCDETEPEWVTIKSVTLYRTKDAEEEQKAAIYFVTNGGNVIEEYYDVAGTAVAKPADPERAGYVFTGWFADAFLTIPYEFTTIPAEGAIVYAGWEKEAAPKPAVSLMGLQAYSLTEGAYTVTNEADKYIIKKTSNGQEWDCVIIPMPESAELGGYTFLKYNISCGSDNVLLKINDTYESLVSGNGSLNVGEVEFDINFDMAKAALVLFINGGTAGESSEIVINNLEYNVRSTYNDTLVSADNWSVGEGSPTSYEIVNGNLILSKNHVGDGSFDWDCIKYQTTANLTGFNRLVMSVRGNAGEKLLVKIYDTQEFWVEMNGNLQELVFDYELDYDSNKPALVLFANGGSDGTGNDFNIVLSYFEIASAEEEKKEPVKEADLIIGNLEVGADHTAETVLVISKQNAGEWDNVQIAIDGIEGATKLNVVIQGQAESSILFKVNDQKEYWHTCNGEKEVLSFDITDLTWNANNKAIVLFPAVQGTGLGEQFNIYKLELLDGEKSYDLLKGAISKGNCSADRVLNISKTGANEWDCIKITTGLDLSEIAELHVNMRGFVNEQVLIKVNDTKEFWIVFDKENVTAVLDLAGLVFDSSKADIVLFANPGATGSGNVITFTELKFVAKEQNEAVEEVDLLNAKLEVGGDHQASFGYDVSKNNSGDWDNISIDLKEADGATKLNVKVLGADGKQILFKVNDQVEFWHTCNGELQDVSFDISNLVWNPGNKAIYLFPEAGTTGSGVVFTLSKLELVNGEKSFNLLNGTVEKGNCNAKKFLTFAKTGSTEWDCIKLTSGLNLSEIKFISYAIEGKLGDQVLIKVNDQKEFWVTFEESVTIAVLDLDGLVFDSSKVDVVLFANPGSAGNGNEVKVTELFAFSKPR